MNNNFCNDRDISEALAALTRALASVEGRITAIGSEVTTLQRERRSNLMDEVDRLLPGITGSVMRKLRTQASAFVDGQIQQAFATHAKIFGLIRKPGYERALALLRTRLAAYLDGSLPSITAIDEQIIKLSNEKIELANRAQELHKSVKVLTEAATGKVLLDEESQARASEVAKHARQINSKAMMMTNGKPRVMLADKEFSRRRLDSQPTPTSSSSDDSDIWLYAFTEVPTSFRTLVLSATHHHHESSSVHFQAGGAAEAFSGGGASGSFAADTPHEASETSPPAYIATDDQLGRFS